MALTYAVRMAWAAYAPLSNDESYYWDWSRALQLSFLDHPPGVAWLGWLARQVWGGALAVRGLVPFVHVVSAWFMWRSSELIKGARLSRAELITLLMMTELVPVFSFEGLLLLPDSGLLAALAVSLYCFLRAASVDLSLADAKRRSWSWALAAGVAIGVAGLFKYHAAPVAVGLGLGLLWCWGIHRWREWLEWILICAGVALAVASPVLIWNVQHDWASLRFQGDHGFGGLSFSLIPALRVYFGQMMLLTPYVLFYAIRTAAQRQSTPLARIPQAAFWPLFLLLEILAFGKQMLPHWLAPACWMLLPLISLQARRGWNWYASVSLSVVVTLVLPWFLVVKPLRQGLIDASHGSPGPLSELTLWEPLAEVLTADPRLAGWLREGAASIPGPAACPRAPLLASLRWFWAAQLAYHLPGQPRVLSLDFNHPSYYTFRDDLSSLGDCPVLLIGDERHFNPDLFREALVQDERIPLVVPSHADTTIVVIKGHLRSAAELGALQRRHGLFGGFHH